MTPSIHQRILSIARHHHGIATTGQLAEAGIWPSALTRHVRNGTLERVGRGVYRAGGTPDTRETSWLAAVLSTDSSAALSHTTAAVHLGIWRGQAQGIHVTTPHLGRKGRRGTVVHRSRTFQPDHAATVNGIPTTTPARTAWDVGDELSPWQVANILFESEYHGVLDLAALDRFAARAGGRRADRILRRALHLHRSGSSGTRSMFEDRVLSALLNSGVPEPAVNTPAEVGGRMLELDLYWPTQRLVAEVDGRGHRRQHSRRTDKARDQRLADAGITVIRCTRRTWRQDVVHIARWVGVRPRRRTRVSSTVTRFR